MNLSVVHSLRSASAALAVAAALTSSAAAQTPTPAAVPALAGTWTLAVEGGDHVIPMGLVLEQHGDALTGALALMGKDYPVTGTLNGQAIALTGQAAFGPPGQPAPLGDMTIAGTADAAGTFAGTLTMKMPTRVMAMKYTAERFRERTPAATGRAPASVAGDWTVKIVEAGLTMTMTLSQVGTKVTGTALSDHLGTMTLDGTFVNGTLAFVTTGKNNGQDIRIEYTGTPRANGEFAGDLSSPMGAMTWTSARVRP